MNDQEVRAFLAASTGFEEETNVLPLGMLSSLWSDTLEDVPPWWSSSRDSVLRHFWKDGQQGAGIMFLAQNKLASIPFRVEARDKSITAHVRQAETLTERYLTLSQIGEGYYSAILSFVEDYLGQDNGGFLEIVGEGPADGPITGAIMGIRHLDAARCERTGDPIYPVRYIGDDGKFYKFHLSRVIFLAQMPSSNSRMFGVGYSSVSRSLRILQNLHATVNYKDEKMGARAASQILVGSGITGREILKAIAASEAMMDNLNLRNMARTVALGSVGGEVSLDRVELNALDPFDEETTNTFAAYALATAWGLEFQELIPIVGSKSSDIVSLQRARGQLPQAYRIAFEQQANMKLVPAHLKVTLDFKDDMEDQQRAVIEDIISRSFQRQMDSGVTTPEIVQEVLCERGYISEQQLRDVQLSRGFLPDKSPVQSLFFNPNYQDYLQVPREFLMSTVFSQGSEIALRYIEANEVALYAYMGNTRSSIEIQRSRESLAALAWLRKKYQQAQEEEEIEVSPNPRRELSDGRPSNQEDVAGVGKATNFFRKNRLMITESE